MGRNQQGGRRRTDHLISVGTQRIPHRGKNGPVRPHNPSRRDSSRAFGGSQFRSTSLCVAVVDVRRAYFYAAARRPTSVELPPEDYRPGDEDLCGELQKSLYGTRDAAQNWAAECTRTLRAAGLEPCRRLHATVVTRQETPLSRCMGTILLPPAQRRIWPG